MNTKKLRKGLLLLTLASATPAIGCELIVDFDRTRIPVEASEASIPDSSLSETGAPPVDGGNDAGQDANQDAGADAGPDAADAADGG